jgi:hypothetical protein
MPRVTTHFEQIPVDVVKKIAAQTLEAARPGVGHQPGYAVIATPARSREETLAESSSRPKRVSDRGVR